MFSRWLLVLPLIAVACSRPASREDPLAPAAAPVAPPSTTTPPAAGTFVLDGQDFRARGQEPGWFLGIDHEGALLLVYDYMERRITVPAPQPVTDPGGTITYTTDANSPPIVVTAHNRACHDSMSGQPYAYTVTVKIVERVLTGCGGRVEQAETSGAATPPIPFEDVGACPFEGCVYREWTARSRVTIRADRSDGAPALFELTPGARVTALTGVVVVQSPGIVEFASDTDVPATGGPIRMRQGETMYLLTNLGEGFVKAWAHGRLYSDVDTSGLKARRVASYVWWVQVRDASGRVGWTREVDAFDGKDIHA